MVVSKQFLIRSMILLSCVIKVSHASYPVDLLTNDLIPSLEGSTGFTINGTMYAFGGIDVSGPANEFFKISFDPYGKVVLNSINDQGPITAYSQTVVLSGNDSIATFGGYRPGFFPNNSNVPMRAEVYSFSQNTWTTLPGLDNNTINETAVPSQRYLHTAVMASNGLIYIQGGSPGLEYPYILIDSWVYDPHMGTFANLSIPPFGLYGATATALFDGRIVYVGGSYSITPKSSKKPRFQIDRALIYDTANDTWREQALDTHTIDTLNKSRGYMSVALGPEGRYIYYFAGSNMAPPNNDDELYYNDLLILDTQTWVWQKPNIPGIEPSYRSTTIAARINDEYMLFCFGENNYFAYKELNVLKLPKPVLIENGGIEDNSKELDFESLKWVYNITTGETFEEIIYRIKPHDKLSKSAIIVISIVCSLVAVIILLFILYRISHSTRRFIFMIHGKIWNPRKGDPFWAEATRLVFRIILLFLFIAFFVFIVIQVIRSPISNYTTTLPASDEGIEVPDIRFCFDGFSIGTKDDGSSYPRMRCMGTDGDVSCNDHISELNLSFHMPLHTGAIKCFLFRNNIVGGGDDDKDVKQQQQPLRLSETRDDHGNSMPGIMFVSIIGNASEVEGRIFIEVYPAQRNPNRNVYFDEHVPLLSDQDIAKWKSRDMFTKTGYSFNPTKESGYLDIQPQIKQTLKDTSWNYVGFSSLYNTIPEVLVNYRAISFPSDTIEGALVERAQIRLDIYDSTTIINREQRMYTLVNGLAFIGGLYGLFTAFQIAVFGYRPQSPFGLLYRWSFGPMRRSVYRGLKGGYSEHKDTPIPLVTPVIVTTSSHRYSPSSDQNGKEGMIDNDNNGFSRNNLDEESNYINQHQTKSIEDRVQLLEDLFKSYYMDPEVFQKLDTAMKESETSCEIQEQGSYAGSRRQRRLFSNIFWKKRSAAGYIGTKSTSE